MERGRKGELVYSHHNSAVLEKGCVLIPW
jgi:hypothetical protein